MLLHVLWDKFMLVELLVQRVCAFKTLIDNAKLYYKELLQPLSHQYCVKVPFSLCLYQYSVLVRLVNGLGNFLF